MPKKRYFTAMPYQPYTSAIIDVFVLILFAVVLLAIMMVPAIMGVEPSPDIQYELEGVDPYANR